MTIKKYGRLRRRFKHFPLPIISQISHREKDFVRANDPKTVIATLAGEIMAGVPVEERTLADFGVPF